MSSWLAAGHPGPQGPVGLGGLAVGLLQGDQAVPGPAPPAQPVLADPPGQGRDGGQDRPVQALGRPSRPRSRSSMRSRTNPRTPPRNSPTSRLMPVRGGGWGRPAGQAGLGDHRARGEVERQEPVELDVERLEAVVEWGQPGLGRSGGRWSWPGATDDLLGRGDLLVEPGNVLEQAGLGLGAGVGVAEGQVGVGEGVGAAGRSPGRCRGSGPAAPGSWRARPPGHAVDSLAGIEGVGGDGPDSHGCGRPWTGCGGRSRRPRPRRPPRSGPAGA